MSRIILTIASYSWQTRGGHAYHMLNRENGGATVFHKAEEDFAFLGFLATKSSPGSSLFPL
jgi:hypothetical protein